MTITFTQDQIAELVACDFDMDWVQKTFTKAHHKQARKIYKKMSHRGIAPASGHMVSVMEQDEIFTGLSTDELYRLFHIVNLTA